MASEALHPLHQDALGYVLGAALRYQINRRTYGSGIVADAILAAWPALHPRDRETMRREIASELQRGGGGDACDRESWQRVLDGTHPQLEGDADGE